MHTVNCFDNTARTWLQQPAENVAQRLADLHLEHAAIDALHAHEQRLANLNRHFPVRAPRSGLMPLQS